MDYKNNLNGLDFAILIYEGGFNSNYFKDNYFDFTIGAVFAIIAGFIQCYPVFTGLSIDPKWLKIQFRIIFFGVNLTIFPTKLTKFWWNDTLSCHTIPA